jgi:autotransporter-associated beta strand protein
MNTPPPLLLSHFSSRSLISPILVALLSTLSTSKGATVSFANNSTTNPPGASQAWSIASNWNGGALPAAGDTVNLYRSTNLPVYTLLDTTTQNLALAYINYGSLLQVASGGVLNMQNTDGRIFIGSNAASSLVIQAGGTVQAVNVGAQGANGISLANNSTLTTSGTINHHLITIGVGSTMNVTGGNVTLYRSFDSVTVGGTLNQTGGNISATPSISVTTGTYRISGGNVTTTDVTQGLYFKGANATSGGTLQVVGSNATINFRSFRNDVTVASGNVTPTFSFILDNSAAHISTVNFVANGQTGAALRTNTKLNVGLNGGVLLSGTNQYTIISRVSGSDSAWQSGPGPLWTDSTVSTNATTKAQIKIALNGSADQGGLNYRGANSQDFTGTAQGYLDLSNVDATQAMTMYLNVSGGTLSNFTNALTSAGVTWGNATGDYNVMLTLNPSTSGSNYFAFDLASIDAGMTVNSLAVDSTFGVGSGNTTTVSEVISGKGGLRKNDAGTLVLSGNNTYSGITTISAGTLQVGAGAGSGAISANSSIVNNAVLSLNRTGTLTLGSQISGSGNLLQQGSGVSILTANNTYTGTTLITAGTIQIGNNAASGALGSGNVSVSGSGVLDFNRSDVVTVANNLSGNGTIRRSGTGSTTLSGTNTNSGEISITGGALLFDGANALSSSATLLNATGSGSTFSLADGTTRNSTLSAGSLTMNGSNFAFDVNGAASDFLSLSGSASLTGGGKIKLNLLSAPVAATTWNLLSATGGLSGDWTLDLTSFATGDYSWGLTYGPNTLTLSATISSSNLYWKGGTGENWSVASNWTTDTAGNSTSLNAPSSTSDVTFSAVGAANQTNTSLGGNLSVNTLTISDPSGVLINGGYTLTANASSVTAFNITAASGTTTINASLAGAGAGLNKSGGGTLVLGGANTYGGGTMLQAGTIKIGSDASLGASQGALTIDPQTGNTATIVFDTGGITLNANRTVTLSSGTAALNTQSFNATIAGAIQGAGQLQKTGAGTLLLSGSNNFAGGALVSAGTLAVIGGNAISNTGTVTLANTAGVLFSILGSETIGSLQGGGALGGNTDIAAGQVLTVSETGSTSYAGAITNAGTMAMSGTGSSTLSGVISGTGGVSVTGSGSMILSGNNTFSGGISIASGTLQIGAGGGTGAIASGAIANNGTLVVNRTGEFSVSNQISGTGSLVKQGAGTLSLSGSNSYTGGSTLSAGTLVLENANGLAASGTISMAGATLKYGTGITTDLSSRFSTVSNQSYAIDTNGNSITFAGALTSSSGTLVKSGNGTLTLSGNNTYTGGTTVSAGVLRGTGNSTLGNGGSITVNSGAALELLGTGTFARPISLSGTGLSGTGALRNISGNKTISGAITLVGDTTIHSVSDTLSFDVASGSAVTGTYNLTFGGDGNILFSDGIGTNSGSITKVGNGTLTFAGANTYTGATTIQSGTIVIGRNGAISNQSDLSVSGGTLNLGAFTHGFFNKNVTLTSGSIIATTGNLSGTGTSSSYLLESGTVTASLQGTAQLVKSTAGTVTLSGNNSFTGNTTINGGTLVAAGQNALGSTPNIIVNHGGSLLVTADASLNASANMTLATGTSVAGLVFSGNYNGYIGALTLSADSIIDLGTSNSVYFDIANLNLAGNSLRFYNWDGNSVWSGNPGAGNDRIYVRNGISNGDLSRISFYSGFGTGFLSTAYQIDGGLYANQIIAIPEVKTWFTAFLLLAGLSYTAFWRRRVANKANKAHSLTFPLRGHSSIALDPR